MGKAKNAWPGLLPVNADRGHIAYKRGEKKRELVDAEVIASRDPRLSPGLAPSSVYFHPGGGLYSDDEEIARSQSFNSEDWFTEDRGKDFEEEAKNLKVRIHVNPKFVPDSQKSTRVDGAMWDELEIDSNDAPEGVVEEMEEKQEKWNAIKSMTHRPSKFMKATYGEKQISNKKIDLILGEYEDVLEKELCGVMRGQAASSFKHLPALSIGTQLQSSKIDCSGIKQIYLKNLQEWMTKKPLSLLLAGKINPDRLKQLPDVPSSEQIDTLAELYLEEFLVSSHAQVHGSKPGSVFDEPKTTSEDIANDLFAEIKQQLNSILSEAETTPRQTEAALFPAARPEPAMPPAIPPAFPAPGATSYPMIDTSIPPPPLMMGGSSGNQMPIPPMGVPPLQLPGMPPFMAGNAPLPPPMPDNGYQAYGIPPPVPPSVPGIGSTDYGIGRVDDLRRQGPDVYSPTHPTGLEEEALASPGLDSKRKVEPITIQASKKKKFERKGLEEEEDEEKPAEKDERKDGKLEKLRELKELFERKKKEKKSEKSRDKDYEKSRGRDDDRDRYDDRKRDSRDRDRRSRDRSYDRNRSRDRSRDRYDDRRGRDGRDGRDRYSSRGDKYRDNRGRGYGKYGRNRDRDDYRDRRGGGRKDDFSPDQRSGGYRPVTRTSMNNRNAGRSEYRDTGVERLLSSQWREKSCFHDGLLSYTCDPIISDKRQLPKINGWSIFTNFRENNDDVLNNLDELSTQRTKFLAKVHADHINQYLWALILSFHEKELQQLEYQEQQRKLAEEEQKAAVLISEANVSEYGSTVDEGKEVKKEGEEGGVEVKEETQEEEEMRRRRPMTLAAKGAKACSLLMAFQQARDAAQNKEESKTKPVKLNPVAAAQRPAPKPAAMLFKPVAEQDLSEVNDKPSIASLSSSDFAYQLLADIHKKNTMLSTALANFAELSRKYICSLHSNNTLDLLMKNTSHWVKIPALKFGSDKVIDIVEHYRLRVRNKTWLVETGKLHEELPPKEEKPAPECKKVEEVKPAVPAHPEQIIPGMKEEEKNAIFSKGSKLLAAFRQSLIAKKKAQKDDTTKPSRFDQPPPSTQFDSTSSKLMEAFTRLSQPNASGNSGSQSYDYQPPPPPPGEDAGNGSGDDMEIDDDTPMEGVDDDADKTKVAPRIKQAPVLYKHEPIELPDLSKPPPVPEYDYTAWQNYYSQLGYNSTSNSATQQGYWQWSQQPDGTWGPSYHIGYNDANQSGGYSADQQQQSQVPEQPAVPLYGVSRAVSVSSESTTPELLAGESPFADLQCYVFKSDSAASGSAQRYLKFMEAKMFDPNNVHLMGPSDEKRYVFVHRHDHSQIDRIPNLLALKHPVSNVTFTTYDDVWSIKKQMYKSMNTIMGNGGVVVIDDVCILNITANNLEAILEYLLQETVANAVWFCRVRQTIYEEIDKRRASLPVTSPDFKRLGRLVEILIKYQDLQVIQLVTLQESPCHMLSSPEFLPLCIQEQTKRDSQGRHIVFLTDLPHDHPCLGAFKPRGVIVTSASDFIKSFIRTEAEDNTFTLAPDYGARDGEVYTEVPLSNGVEKISFEEFAPIA
ncbi:hypothetical protein CAPTEDRAFT_224837 [Capitella teleta]|uniref:TASOR PIN domain-containing protein n=1 Tax=Capitella teleta TaxID=283909 RepID=R7UJL4_CAPTE|nr:hypothetical protein CAPTEDRAFT_224837 [Capitella teleta]|eukprot:ELU06308.1 hypothetical protein CAPTEDRAFT_224837 [Capitella teleta]